MHSCNAKSLVTALSNSILLDNQHFFTKSHSPSASSTSTQYESPTNCGFPEFVYENCLRLTSKDNSAGFCEVLQRIATSLRPLRCVRTWYLYAVLVHQTRGAVSATRRRAYTWDGMSAGIFIATHFDNRNNKVAMDANFSCLHPCRIYLHTILRTTGNNIFRKGFSHSCADA